MSNGHARPAADREQLSALVDGELAPGAAVTAACAAWKDDAAMRAAWHGYQLIGDVLRSEDLASAPARDAAFLQTLRERLAAEPVVLAPLTTEPSVRSANGATATVLSDARSRRRWAMPAAVAAGFVVVAGALLVTRAPQPAADGQIAGDSRTAPLLAGVPSSLLATVSAAPDPAATPLVVVEPGPGRGTFVTSNRILLRDPQLDRYLAAHKRFADSTALGMTAGALRNASAEAPGR